MLFGCTKNSRVEATMTAPMRVRLFGLRNTRVRSDADSPIQELRDRVARRGGITNRESRAEARLSRRISPGRVRASAQATLKTSTR